eukprot:2868147-Rhodomonas_salina.1
MGRSMKPSRLPDCPRARMVFWLPWLSTGDARWASVRFRGRPRVIERGGQCLDEEYVWPDLPAVQ